MKLFFATDVHGSEICWKKFISASKFYEVDTVILARYDRQGNRADYFQGGSKYKVTLLDQETSSTPRKHWIICVTSRTWLLSLCHRSGRVAQISATPGAPTRSSSRKRLRQCDTGWNMRMPNWKALHCAACLPGQ